MPRYQVKPWPLMDGSVTCHYSPIDEGVFFEAIATNPKSSRGKVVDIYVPNEMVDALLRVLRDQAIRMRNRGPDEERLEPDADHAFMMEHHGRLDDPLGDLGRWINEVQNRADGGVHG